MLKAAAGLDECNKAAAGSVKLYHTAVYLLPWKQSVLMHVSVGLCVESPLQETFQRKDYGSLIGRSWNMAGFNAG